MGASNYPARGATTGATTGSTKISGGSTTLQKGLTGGSTRASGGATEVPPEVPHPEPDRCHRGASCYGPFAQEVPPRMLKKTSPRSTTLKQSFRENLGGTSGPTSPMHDGPRWHLGGTFRVSGFHVGGTSVAPPQNLGRFHFSKWWHLFFCPLQFLWNLGGTSGGTSFAPDGGPIAHSKCSSS